MGRYEGMAVFVALAAPGDLLRVRLSRVRKRFALGEIVEVLEPGSERREPPCSLFSDCGGCDWMHVSEAAQQRARTMIVRDALQRIAHLTELPEIDYVSSPAQLGYRSRARIAHAARQVGFRARASHFVIDVERCPVLDESTQKELDRVRDRSPRGRGEVSIRGYGDTLDIGVNRYSVGENAFFQTNRSLWETWLQLVLNACGEGGLAVEFYAGVGFYTAGLVKRFSRVIAVERGAHARDAARNSNAEIVEASAESWAPGKLSGLAPELVLLNPPRTGCHRSVVNAVRDSGAQRVVYVSCEPSTLARDVEVLAPSYSVTEITCIDALPQTHHVEVIASMTKSV